MCSMSAGAYRRSPAPRTRQTVITQDKVRTEAPCTSGLSFKENALLCSAAPASTLHFTSAIFFFLPGESQDRHRHSLKKRKGAVFPLDTPSLHLCFLILLVSSSCLEDSRGHWDSRLWYGLKTSVMLRGGGRGTRCSALHGNQMKALSVELNLHSKSPYGADYHTWERERRMRRNVLVITS